MDVLLYAANFALLMAINVTIAWACSRILPLRNPRTIYVVQIVSCVLGIWVTWLDITPINPLCFTFFYGVVPYLCWDAPRAQRVVCAVMLLLFLLACESLTNSLITLAGNPYLNRRWGAPETMIVCRLAYVALIVAGTELLRKVAGQVLRGGSAGPVGWYGRSSPSSSSPASPTSTCSSTPSPPNSTSTPSSSCSPRASSRTSWRSTR